ncbi:ATP-binding protein [Actinotalea sp. Marseille-Q4924]|uniref:ATP-binding protein n=1 Tax=Actinotalea sp. Marseille-Q4924 TaxID=2866571 RepID=UPI001CE45BA9|nr:ATP-binding protein [Actinotalea sp. Marseille-Q4924]
MTFERGDLAAVRRTVRRCAVSAGLDAGRTDDLVLAASELAANSVDHGGGRGSLRTWHDEGSVVVEVSDSGHIADHEVGSRPPTADSERGRGLWMARRLADRFVLHTGRHGTTARLVALV